jgi:exonuclease I
MAEKKEKTKSRIISTSIPEHIDSRIRDLGFRYPEIIKRGLKSVLDELEEEKMKQKKQHDLEQELINQQQTLRT